MKTRYILLILFMVIVLIPFYPKPVFKPIEVVDTYSVMEDTSSFYNKTGWRPISNNTTHLFEIVVSIKNIYNIPFCLPGHSCEGPFLSSWLLSPEGFITEYSPNATVYPGETVSIYTFVTLDSPIETTWCTNINLILHILSGNKWTMVYETPENARACMKNSELKSIY